MMPSLSEMRRGVGAAAREGRVRRVLHGKLDLLRHPVAAQQGNHAQRSVEAGGDTGSTHVLAVHHHAFIAGYGAVVFKQMKSGPMRGGTHALQQPGGPADQGSRADREDASGVRRLTANEREDRLIVHQLLLSPAARHHQHIQVGRLGECHFRRQYQARDVSQGCFVFPEHVKPGAGNTREHFEWTSEVHLIHAGKDDRADFDRVHITGSIARIVGRSPWTAADAHVGLSRWSKALNPPNKRAGPGGPAQTRGSAPRNSSSISDIWNRTWLRPRAARLENHGYPDG